MTEVKSGPAPYIYTSTRLRVRKAKLLPREDYLRMQNMSLPEIARFIGESEYKSEIDELGGVFHGIDLIEIALSWNLAKENQSVLGITQGSLMQFTANYLRSWDIGNVLIILRGKRQGFSANKIKEVLQDLPADYGKAALFRGRTALEILEVDRERATTEVRLSLRTVKRHLSVLSALWKWIAREGTEITNPFGGFSFPSLKRANEQRD